MRIAIFSDTYPPQINGVATSTYNLVNTLKAHGHDVLLVTVNRTDTKFNFSEGVVEIPGILLKRIYGYRLAPIYHGKAMRVIRDWNPEIIHNQTDAAVGQFAKIVARHLKIPIVYTYHTQYEDYTYYVTKGNFDRIARNVIQYYSRMVAKGSTGFITPSVKTKEMMRMYGSDVHISVIPTGIDFSLFEENKIDKKEVDEFKKEHGIKENTLVFLILGRLANEKSMDVSINYYAGFLKKHPEIDTKMFIVGGGPARNSLELLTHELKIADKVEFIGPVPASRVPFFYYLADVYTSASITETQGLTFMEAMASRTLVLARYDDNLTGVIEDNETGFFFTSEDTFIEKVERIIASNQEEKERIHENALKIIEKYSIQTFYENVMEVYLRCVKKYW
ncbi:MAG: glycosyltransferase [Bacilli bacterium]|jgi:1,2-diacylglycerol 3-alpha-glucosyltransferase|nr:glycosyltransferase [Bacilli bacterium]